MKIFNVDWLIDLEKSILWQYDKATKLNALIKAKQKWYQQNVSFFITNFFLNVFDIKRANDFGLNVWGKLLNFPRQVMLNKYQITAEQTEGTDLTDIVVVRNTFNNKVESGDDFTATTIEENSKYTFIFTYNGADWDLSGSFSASNVDIADYGISFTGTPQTDDSITIIADYTPLNLTTEQYRFLLLGQVLKFKMSATLPEINKYLRVIFEQENNDNVYVTDNHNMTISYKLAPTVLNSDVKKLIDNYDFLPHPAGVKVNTTSTTYYNFEIETLPTNATVKFTVNGQEYVQKSIDVELGTDIHWEVSGNGWITQSGTETNLTTNKKIQVVLKTTITLRAVPSSSSIVLTINGTEYEGEEGYISQEATYGDSYSWTITNTRPSPVPPPTPQPQQEESYYLGEYMPETESGVVTEKIDKVVELQNQEYVYKFNSIYGNGAKSGGFYNIKKTGQYHISLGGDKDSTSKNSGGTAELTLQLQAGDVIEFKAIYGGTHSGERRYIAGAGAVAMLNNNILMVAGGAGLIDGGFVGISLGGGGYIGGQAKSKKGFFSNITANGWSIKDLQRGENTTQNDGAGYANIYSTNTYAYGGSGYVAEEYAEDAVLTYAGNSFGYGYADIYYIEEEE